MKFIYLFNDINSNKYKHKFKDIVSETNIINEILNDDTDIEFEGRIYKVESASDATISLNEEKIEYSIDITEK